MLSPVEVVVAFVSLTLLQVSGEVPRSWSSMSQVFDMDLSDNVLTGAFPLSWRALEGDLGYLKLDNNAQLEVGPWQVGILFLRTSG